MHKMYVVAAYIHWKDQKWRLRDRTVHWEDLWYRSMMQSEHNQYSRLH